MITRNVYERRMREDRAKEARLDSLKKSVHNNVVWGANSQSDKRVSGARQAREHAEREEENSILNQHFSRVEADAARKLQAEREEALKKRIREVDSVKERKAANVRRICEQSDELKALESKLKAALVDKEREVQIEKSLLDRDVIRRTEKHQDQENLAYMQKHGVGLVEQEQQEINRADMYANQKIILEKQILEREYRKNEEYQQFLKEKAQIDEIVKKIEAEEWEKLEVKKQKQAETKLLVNEYLVRRREWQRQREEEDSEELQKIMEHQRMMAERAAAEEAAKGAKREEEERKYARVVADIEAKRNEEEEMELLLMELAMEEAELKRVQEKREKEKKREEMRTEMMAENRRQKQLKAERVASEKEEEEKMRKQLLAKYAEDDRVEQMSREKARRRQIEHRREVEELLKERRAIKAAKKIEDAQREKETEAREIQRVEIIKAERIRLIRAYAEKTKGKLPKGIFHSDEDFKNILSGIEFPSLNE